MMFNRKQLVEKSIPHLIFVSSYNKSSSRTTNLYNFATKYERIIQSDVYNQSYPDIGAIKYMKGLLSFIPIKIYN